MMIVLIHRHLDVIKMTQAPVYGLINLPFPSFLPRISYLIIFVTQ